MKKSIQIIMVGCCIFIAGCNPSSENSTSSQQANKLPAATNTSSKPNSEIIKNKSTETEEEKYLGISGDEVLQRLKTAGIKETDFSDFSKGIGYSSYAPNMQYSIGLDKQINQLNRNVGILLIGDKETVADLTKMFLRFHIADINNPKIRVVMKTYINFVTQSEQETDKIIDDILATYINNLKGRKTDLFVQKIINGYSISHSNFREVLAFSIKKQ